MDVISPGHPTYWPSDPKKVPDLIDFAISRNINRNSVTTETSYDLSSDHSPVILTYYANIPGSAIDSKYKTNWLKYKKFISSHINTNPVVHSEAEIEKSVDDFTFVMTSALEHSKYQLSPKFATNVSNSEIEGLLLEKRRLRREWQQNRSPGAKQRLSAANRKLRSALHLDEDRKNKNYIESLSNTKHTNFSIWKAAKTIKTPVEVQSPLRKPDGTWARSAEDKASIFADHLSNVFQPNSSANEQILEESSGNASLNSEPINIAPEDIQAVINKNLKVKKAPGYDAITPLMIKNLPQVAIIVLSVIFNAIIEVGIFPKSWKTSLIIMIPKPGKDLNVPSSYRPISLLPCLSKLFENVLRNKMMPFLNERNIIPPHQFGFREQHGTIEQVNRLTAEIRKCFELKKYCSAIFIDVAQAFDKVWHEGLIHKIKRCLPPITHKVLESYLTNRQFRVKCNDYVTHEYEIEAGVPQGSVLGPILYLIYTSDLPECDSLTISTFADDTAVLSSQNDPSLASRELNKYLRLLEKWLKKWRIKVNEIKSKHVTFSLRRGDCPSVTLNNVCIPQSDHVTYLGVHLDRRLTWRRHIEAKRLNMRIKASNLHWLINEQSRLSLDCKVLLYKAILKPIWTYGIQLWGTASSSSIDLIQRAQSKILRTITGAPWYIRNDNIHRDLDVPMVKEVFKKVRENYQLKLQDHPNPFARQLLSTQHTTRLRRNDLPPR